MKRGQKLKVLILCIIILAEVLNVLTFALLRRNKDNLGAELIYLKEDVHSEITNYVIAGLLNQADVTFHDFINEMDGSVVCVNYKRTGWRPEVMANEIYRDAHYRRGKIRVWAISVGDQTARHLDSLLPCAETVAINPCVEAECLKNDLQKLHGVAKALRGFCEYGLGWLSLAPIVSMAGTDANAPNRNWKYSPILLMDQLVAITGGLQGLGSRPFESEHVILSEHDQFLNNSVIIPLYDHGKTNFITIEADHAGVVNYRKAYREAFQQTGWMRSNH